MEKTDKASSIEVSQNAKGEYSFKVKLYYDIDEKEGKDIVDEIDKLMRDLKIKFRSK